MGMIENAKWVGVSQSAKIFAQVSNLILLTRILSPSDFGLMAVAGVATNLAVLFRDMGTSAAVIQKETLTDDIRKGVFCLNLMMGMLVFIAISGLSKILSVFFGEPELTPILILLALTFPITSSSLLHQALLERESRFKDLARIEVVSTFLSLIAAISMALSGFGVYSLVGQVLISAILTSVQLWMASVWRPGFRFGLSGIKDIYRFSSNMFAYQIFSYFFRNSDVLIIGRTLGVSAVGVYSIASKIMLFPVQHLSWVATRMLFPVMSRRQGDINEVSNLYIRSISVLSMVAAPLMFGLFSLRGEFSDFVFGDKWAGLPEVLAWLSLVGYIQVITNCSGPVFMALGLSRALLELAILGAIIHTLFFYMGSRWGVEGVALGYFSASLIVFPITLLYLGRHIKFSHMMVAKALFPSLISSLVMVLSIAATRNFTVSISEGFIRFALMILSGFSSYCVMILIFEKGAASLVGKLVFGERS